MKRKLVVFLILNLSLVHTQCQTEEKAQQQAMNVGFLLVDGVYNTEVIAPFDVFQHTIYHAPPGMQVFTIASNTNPITTFEGLKILPDYSYKDPNLPSIDVLVVASAKHSMDSDLENKEMIEWVRQTGSNAIYTISLCDGAFVVAKAGLADGKVTTTFPSDIPRYREMFPHLEVMEAVSFVHDENLITSAGGVKSYDVAMYLVEKLYGNQVASNIGAGLIIDWNLDKVPHFVNNRP
jgi:transcriptional regulator GlxA family with amidase domain